MEEGWSLYEVPLYGGHGMLSGRFDTFPEAVEYAKDNLRKNRYETRRYR